EDDVAHVAPWLLDEVPAHARSRRHPQTTALGIREDVLVRLLDEVAVLPVLRRPPLLQRERQNRRDVLLGPGGLDDARHQAVSLRSMPRRLSIRDMSSDGVPVIPLPASSSAMPSSIAASRAACFSSAGASSMYSRNLASWGSGHVRTAFNKVTATRRLPSSDRVSP